MAITRYEPGRFEIIYDIDTESLSEEFNGDGQWTIKISKLKNKQIFLGVEDTTATQFIKPDLPSVKDVEDFIMNKPNFEHDNAEIQEHFLNRALESRGADKKLYFAFVNIIRKAKENIAITINGNWESHGTRQLENRKHAKVFSFKRDETNQSRFNYGENKIK